MKKLAIMQPYLLPYIGYWQLLAAVDEFVVYDNIKYTKAGWINRNRFLQSGGPALFTLPVAKDSDSLSVRERRVSGGASDRAKIINRLAASYARAPHFTTVFPMLEAVFRDPSPGLFDFVYSSIRRVAQYLEIATPLVVSSTIAMDHTLRAQDRVIGTCKALGATHYLNLPGGRDLYDRGAFAGEGIELRFVQPRHVAYPQLGGEFVPNLSIIDVMMFNSTDRTRALLAEWDLAE